MRNYDTGMSEQREPDLSGDEAAHCARVCRHVEAEIAAAGGWIGFERYMDLVLYAPGLGYYSAGAHKFGPAGDFTTAPEISALFGGCVARQCAQVLNAVTAGSILEIGAGSGRLAGDILARLEHLGRLPDHYWILEVSADLRERQHRYLQERVGHLLERVEWLDAPPGKAFNGVVLANEVLDALPVARFHRQGNRIAELGVSVQEGRFVWSPKPAGAAMIETCRALAAAVGDAWEDGYVSEYCPRLADWTASVTRRLASGAALWFDYGLPRAHYYFPERRDGTLLCHHHHRTFGDPFRHPGLADITAWVDFTALAEAGSAAGFEIAGFTTQTYFLAATGIDGEMRTIAGADENRFARLAAEARQLMLPGELGERFKAMAWLRGLKIDMAGFTLRDMRHVL